MKAEIKRLKTIEEVHLIEKEAFPYISLNVSVFLKALKTLDMEKIEELLDDKEKIKEKQNEIYFIHEDSETKITYHYEREGLEYWRIESFELIDQNKIEVLVRTQYLDKNKNFVKVDDLWLLSNMMIT